MTFHYLVTKQFIDGLLKGLTITEKTSVRFEVGKVYSGNASAYIVTHCIQIG